MQIDLFTGGIFETNGYLVTTGQGTTLVDAPDGIAAWLEERGKKVDLLLLTHGHVDHILDAAEMKKRHGCRIAAHADTVPMVADRDFFRRFGFELEVDPVEVDEVLEPAASKELGGLDCEILLVPGHCPGSLCFHVKEERLLFGGDVLFAGGIGRWDLPGGDHDLLLRGIREKLLPLGDEVKVLPGHGPATTIGHERQTNPFLTGAP